MLQSEYSYLDVEAVYIFFSLESGGDSEKYRCILTSVSIMLGGVFQYPYDRIEFRDGGDICTYVYNVWR